MEQGKHDRLPKQRLSRLEVLAPSQRAGSGLRSPLPQARRAGAWGIRG